MRKNILTVSFFLSVFSKAPRTMTFEEVIEWVRTCRFGEVLEIRRLYRAGKKAEADERKRKLPAFTPSGVFDHGHRARNLVDYTCRVMLDFDKVETDLKALKQKALEIPFTESAFISVSDKGMKISVRVDCTAEEHLSMYQSVCLFYEKALGIPADAKCTDICRLCYLSADPEAYYNPASRVFTFADRLPDDPASMRPLNPGNGLGTQVTAAPPPETQERVAPPSPASIPDDSLYTADSVARFLTWFETRNSFLEGERNSSLFKLSSLACSYGIPETMLATEAEKRYLSPTFPPSEIASTIRGAYLRNSSQFGTKKEKFMGFWDKRTDGTLCPKKNEHIEENIDTEEGESLREKTPCFSNDVYGKLPYVLKEPLRWATNEREKDCLLLSLLASLGGCMYTVHGYYDRKKYSPHLFVFFTAGAGQGKGIITYARWITEQFENLIRTESDQEVKKYKSEMEKWEQETARLRKKGQMADFDKKPQEVHSKFLYIPTIISRSKLIGQLRDNGAMGGIMFDTEADSFTNANKSDYGQFSEVIRRCFQHEKIASLFKVDGELPIQVRFPMLALILSGTPSQLKKLIPSAENGLYSRFLHYTFRSKPQWRDVSPQENDDEQEKHLFNLASYWCEQANYLRKKRLKVTLSKSQWKEVNSFFDQLLKEANMAENEEFQAVVKRHGLIFYRICMVLTALRECESHSALEERSCLPEDFTCAKEIVHCCLKHSLLLMSSLDEDEEEKELQAPDRLIKVLESMPNHFKTSQILNVCENLKINRKTLQRFLSNVQGLLIKRIHKGYYSKIEKDSPDSEK